MLSAGVAPWVEFSHVSLRARFSGARRLLGAIQADDAVEAERPYTARGHAFDAAACLLAFEERERLAEVGEELANGFRLQVALIDSDEHSRTIENLLVRAYDLRTFDSANPTYPLQTPRGWSPVYAPESVRKDGDR